MDCEKPEALRGLGVEYGAGGETIPRRLAILLAAEAIENLVEAGQTPCVYVGDEKGLEALEELLEARGLAERVVLVKELDACRGFPVVALWPRRIIEGLDYRLLIGVGVKPSKLGLRRVSVKLLPRGGYRLKIGSIEILVVEVEGRLCEYQPEMNPALEALAEALREYGPLKLSEAVQVVASALGVKRSEARQLIYQAVAEGLVEVRDGYVTDVAYGGRR